MFDNKRGGAVGGWPPEDSERSERKPEERMQWSDEVPEG